jgi:hypothetical protein
MMHVRMAVFAVLLSLLPNAWAARVLIIFDDSTPQRQAHAQSVQNAFPSTTTVERVTSVPDAATLASFDHAWDVRGLSAAISPAEISRYVSYLALGKTLVVLGEHSQFDGRNTSLLNLISAAGGGGGLTLGLSAGVSTQTVQTPFTGPNTIVNNDVRFADSRGVNNAGAGQFITVEPSTGVGTAIAFMPGRLENAAAGTLIAVFDVNWLDPQSFDAPDDVNLLRNIVSFLSPAAPPQAIGTVIPNAGRPFGVAVSNGYAYVADPQSHTVWKLELSNPANKTPVAGIGWNADVDPLERAGYNGDGIDALQAQLSNPSGVAIDSAGNLYIADRGNHAVRKIAAGSSFITTVAGIPTSYAVGENTQPGCETGAVDLAQCVNATSLRLFGPRALAVDEDDNLYIVDEMNYQVKKLYTEGTLKDLIFVIAGVAGQPGNIDGPTNGPAFCPECTLGARLNAPAGVAIRGSTAYIADSGNNAIRTVSTVRTASVDRQVNTLDVGPLSRPTGVAVGSGGAVYIADYGNHRIRRATNCPGDGCVVTIVGTGSPGSLGGAGTPGTDVQLNSPIAVTLDGTLLYIADMLNGRILSGDFTPPPVITLH